MIGDNRFVTSPQLFSSQVSGGGIWTDITIYSTGQKANLFRSFYPTYDCPTLATFVPAQLYQPQSPSLNDGTLIEGGIVPVSTASFSMNAGNDGSGTFQIQLLVADYLGNETGYGQFDVTWSRTAGVTTANAVNNTTYGANVTIGNDVGGVGGVRFTFNNATGTFPGGTITFSTTVTGTVQTGNSSGWIGDIIPACAVTPVVNPLTGFRIAFPLTSADNGLGLAAPPLFARVDLVNHAKSMNIFSFLK